MRRSSHLLAAALLSIGGVALAQTSGAKPNFTGKWAIIHDTGAAAAQQGAAASAADYGGLGDASEIVMDDKTLTINRPSQMVPKSVFNLDGTDTHASVDIGGGQMVDLVLRAKWEGNKLMTATLASVQGQQFEIDLNLSLDDKGNLVSEHIVPPLGNGMQGGTMVNKYKKQ
jgi:hypothetical protein